MSKTPAQLDREIAEFLAKPKVGDPKWEREWAALLTEKHSKARKPTIDEIAHALSYVEREYAVKGDINGEQWAEGLAFGQRSSIDMTDKALAKEMLKLLPEADWLLIAERANYLAQEQGEAARYRK